MSIRSKWLFILVGDNSTGKTTLQKKIIKELSDDNRDIRLDCNIKFQITHPYLIRKIKDFSIGNRSYQEKMNEYVSVENYFNDYFCEADVAFLSSHLNETDIQAMIQHAHRKYYNVCGVFFTNSIDFSSENNAQISALSWDERLIADNPRTDDTNAQNSQLQGIAEILTQMLIQRTVLW